MQRHDQHFLHITLSQATQYTCIEAAPSLYISYASPEQTRPNRYLETLEAAGHKGQRIKKVTKVRQQWLPPGVTNCMVFNFNECI